MSYTSKKIWCRIKHKNVTIITKGKELLGFECYDFDKDICSNPCEVVKNVKNRGSWCNIVRIHYHIINGKCDYPINDKDCIGCDKK